MDPEKAAPVLATWFQKHGRRLPWRRRHDPYEVLVSEFILQQTRMEVGVPRFRRFVKRFPSLAALANARESSVLAEWSGLGYYARARNLHRTAKMVAAQHGGKIPSDPWALRELPGIGPYTAGAIASIAFDRPEPSLDGNQFRVIGRLLGAGSRSQEERRRIEVWARQLLLARSPRVLNQALMDLGSEVCIPRRPRCDACPLFAGCATRGAPEEPQRPTVAKTAETYRALIYRRRGAIWLSRFSKKGPLEGLYLPPMQRTKRLGLPDVRHEFSHRTWRVTLEPRTGRPTGAGRWVTPSQLASLPHSGLTRKLVSLAVARAKAATIQRRA